ncbi:MAG: site-specific integrase [Chloroflexi bacterium]|nr:site-specific integrase [Chloroflexota bacterium]
MAWIEHRGTRWRVCWRQDGARQSETFASKDEAVRFRMSVEGAKNRYPPGYRPGQGWGDAPARDALSLAEWGRRAIDQRRRVTDRTRADYLRDWERHVVPELGHVELAKLSEDDIADWDAGLRDAGLSAKTRANLRGLLSSIVEDALRRRPPLVEHNPVRLFRSDHDGQVEEMCFLTPDEFRLILDHIPKPYRALALLLAGTGLRFGEATALYVRDVNSRAGTLTVHRAWKRAPAGSPDSYALGPPKTRLSRRTISVSPAILDALRLDGRTPTDWLFAGREGGQLYSSTFYDLAWRPAVEAAQGAGLFKTPRVHDLRHSHVAWLIAAGVPLPVIQRRLGHSSIRTTIDRYGHLLPDLQSGVSAAVDAALGEPRTRDSGSEPRPDEPPDDQH